MSKSELVECARAVFIEDDDSSKGVVLGVRFAIDDHERTPAELFLIAQETLAD